MVAPRFPMFYKRSQQIHQCVCVCVCVFIKLHITAQSGLVILVIILCHSRWSSQGGINDTCVCVCCHPIYTGRQVCGRTSRVHTGGRSHRISPRSFCGACLNVSRDNDSAVPFPRRPWGEFCVLTIWSFSTCWGIFIFIFSFFLWGKIPVRVTTLRFELKSQRQKVSRLPTEPPGRSTICITLSHELPGTITVEIFYIPDLYFSNGAPWVSGGSLAPCPR